MRFFCLVALFCISFKSWAQDSTLVYNASIAVGGATEQTPFYFSSRQSGTVPLDGNFAVGRFSLAKIYQPHDPRFFQWSAKAEVIGNYGKKGDAFFADLYGAVKLGNIELLVGQQRTMVGLLMDSTLSSGSLAYSDNARPYPKVQLSTVGFLPLAFTNNFVSVKASYSDGLLQGSSINYGLVPSVDQTYFHQKSLYLKFGQTQNKLSLFAGINHQVVWGGEKEIDPLYHISRSKAYWHVITGSKLDYKIIGNHFGTIDLGASWKEKKWTYSVYRQNIYDTGSLFKAINFVDGLNGISIKRNTKLPKDATYFAINSAVIEVTGLKNQENTNPAMGLGIYQLGNYYNHYIYQNGWSYRGMNMGFPLVQGSEQLQSDLEPNKSEFTSNNRLWAFHSGVSATWLKLNLMLKATHTLNYGTYVSPYKSVKHQTYLLLSAERNVRILGGSSLLLAVSSDYGSISPNSYGLMVGLRKAGILN